MRNKLWECARIGCGTVIMTPYEDLLAGITLTKAYWSYDACRGNVYCPEHGPVLLA